MSSNDLICRYSLNKRICLWRSPTKANFGHNATQEFLTAKDSLVETKLDVGISIVPLCNFFSSNNWLNFSLSKLFEYANKFMFLKFFDNEHTWPTISSCAQSKFYHNEISKNDTNNTRGRWAIFEFDQLEILLNYIIQNIWPCLQVNGLFDIGFVKNQVCMLYIYVVKNNTLLCNFFFVNVKKKSVKGVHLGQPIYKYPGYKSGLLIDTSSCPKRSRLINFEYPDGKIYCVDKEEKQWNLFVYSNDIIPKLLAEDAKYIKFDFLKRGKHISRNIDLRANTNVWSPTNELERIHINIDWIN